MTVDIGPHLHGFTLDGVREEPVLCHTYVLVALQNENFK